MRTTIASLFLFTLILSHPGVSQSRNTSPQDIKAVYLYNFLRFVSWPTNSNDHKPSEQHAKPVTICILGKEPYTSAFQSVENKPLKPDQRILVIDRFKTFSNNNALLHCHLLFITASAQLSSQQLMPEFTNSSALLVGETAGFIEAGGMIEFHRVGDKIRWKINLTSATSAGFKIDRRLLKSATQVIQTPLQEINKPETALPDISTQSTGAEL